MEALKVQQAYDDRIKADAEKARQEGIKLQQEQEETARAEIERNQKSVDNCDRLASNPNDLQKPSDVDGASYDFLAVNVAEAISACSVAVNLNPKQPRFRYQLARALQITRPNEAWPKFQALMREQYPAAFDNAARIQIKPFKNYGEAIRFAKSGTRLNDPDSMVTLAELIEKNYYQPQSQDESRISLLSHAAMLGHKGAQAVLNQENAKSTSDNAKIAQDQIGQAKALDFLNNVIQLIPRR